MWLPKTSNGVPTPPGCAIDVALELPLSPHWIVTLVSGKSLSDASGSASMKVATCTLMSGWPSTALMGVAVAVSGASATVAVLLDVVVLPPSSA